MKEDPKETTEATDNKRKADDKVAEDAQHKKSPKKAGPAEKLAYTRTMCRVKFSCMLRLLPVRG